MSQLKSYVVRIWRSGAAGESLVLGVVEPMDEDRKGTNDSLEEFLEALQWAKGPHSPRRRTFSSFEELRDLLGSSW